MRQDIPGRIHLPAVDASTLRAHPLANGQRQCFLDRSPCRTALAGRKPATSDKHQTTTPFCLVFQLSAKLEEIHILAMDRASRWFFNIPRTFSSSIAMG